jgi:hypothetical protein
MSSDMPPCFLQAFKVCVKPFARKDDLHAAISAGLKLEKFFTDRILLITLHSLHIRESFAEPYISKLLPKTKTGAQPVIST